MQIAAEGVKKSLINSAIKNQVDYLFPSTVNANQNSTQSQITNGDKAIAGIGFVLSAADYGNSKNDKQRAFAAADMSVSVLLGTNPPAGAIAGLAVTAIRIADALISMDRRTRMAKYQEELNREYTKLIAIKQRQLNQESQYIEAYLTLIDKYTNVRNTNSIQVSKICNKLKNNQTNLKLMNECIEYSKRYIFSLQVLIRVTEQIELNTRNLALRQSPEVQQMILGINENNKKILQILQSRTNDLNLLETKYNELISEQFIEKLRQQFDIEQFEKHTSDCNLLISKLSMKIAIVVSHYQKLSSLKSQGVKLNKFEFHSLLQSASQMKSSFCYQIKSDLFDGQYESAMIILENYLEEKEDFENILAKLNKLTYHGDWQ